MTNKIKLEDIDFDNPEQMQALAKEKVEIDVRLLSVLLGCFYLGGGEPRKKNDRLKTAKEYM